MAMHSDAAQCADIIGSGAVDPAAATTQPKKFAVWPVGA